MAFAFDPYAALERARRAAASPARQSPPAALATPATLATAEPPPAGAVAGVATVATSTAPKSPARGPASPACGTADADALLQRLRVGGPLTTGSIGRAFGWGATRAWQAEMELVRRGRVAHDRQGRAFALGAAADLSGVDRARTSWGDRP